jgi:hypothetical protein
MKFFDLSKLAGMLTDADIFLAGKGELELSSENKYYWQLKSDLVYNFYKAYK